MKNRRVRLKSIAALSSLAIIASMVSVSPTQAAQTDTQAGAVISTTTPTIVVSAPDVALDFGDTPVATAEAPAPEPEEETEADTPTSTGTQAASRSASRSVQSATSTSTSTSTTVTATTTDASSSFGSEAVEIAKLYLGTPYVWAGSSPSVGFDCSGLVQYVYAQLGVSMPRTSEEQAAAYPVTSNPVPGDLVHYPGHIGIYIGNGMMIHSPKPGDVVKISSVYGSPTYHHVS